MFAKESREAERTLEEVHFSENTGQNPCITNGGDDLQSRLPMELLHVDLTTYGLDYGAIPYINGYPWS